jgi:hypothetical protein
MAYKIQTRNNKIKPFTEYDSVSQNVLFGNAILAALMSGRNMTAYLNMTTSRESNVRTSVFRNEVRYQNATPLQNSHSDTAVSRDW